MEGAAMDKDDLSKGGPTSDPTEEAKEVLRVLRKCRSRLNSLDLHHAAAYADIAVQLLKQSIATQEQEKQQS
jgi:hypothetical protein